MKCCHNFLTHILFQQKKIIKVWNDINKKDRILLLGELFFYSLGKKQLAILNNVSLL